MTNEAFVVLFFVVWEILASTTALSLTNIIAYIKCYQNQTLVTVHVLYNDSKIAAVTFAFCLTVINLFSKIQYVIFDSSFTNMSELNANV